MDYRNPPPRDPRGRGPNGPRGPHGPRDPRDPRGRGQHYDHRRPDDRRPPQAPPVPYNQGGSQSKYKKTSKPQPQQPSRVVPYEYYSKKHHKHKKSQHAYVKGQMSAEEFNKSITDDENLYLASEKDDFAIKEKHVVVRKIIVALVCLIASLVLNMLSFRLPLTPAVLTVDFSALPILIACLAVNPATAVGLVFAKAGLYYLYKPAAYVNLPYKIILDLIFILIIWILYQRLIESPRYQERNAFRDMAGIPPKDYSIQVTIISGVIASVVTAIAAVFAFRYITLPIVVRTSDQVDAYTMIYEYYRSAYAELADKFAVVRNFLPTLDNMTVGVLVYNIPITVIKYSVCSIVAAIVFPFVREFVYKPLFGKKEEKKDK